MTDKMNKKTYDILINFINNNYSSSLRNGTITIIDNYTLEIYINKDDVTYVTLKKDYIETEILYINLFNELIHDKLKFNIQ